MIPSNPHKPLKQQPKNPGRRNREEREARDKAENERKKARAEAAAADAAADAATRRAQYGIPTAAATHEHGQGRFRGAGARGGRGGFMGQQRDRHIHQQQQQSAQGEAQIPVSIETKENTEGGSQATSMAATSTRNTRTRQSATMAAASTVGSSAKLSSQTKIKIEPDSSSINLEDAAMGNADHETKQEAKAVNSDTDTISSDQDETAEPQRLNVENINLVSDEDSEINEDEPTTRSRRRRLAGFAPVRLQRREHEERNVTVTTSKDAADAAGHRPADGETQTSADEDAVSSLARDKLVRRSDLEAKHPVRKWKGVYDDEERQNEHDDTMEIDDENTASQDEEEEGLPTKGKQAAESARRRPARKDTASGKNDSNQPVFQTAAEEREWKKRQDDLRVLQAELGKVQIEGQDNSDHTNERKDAIYLFQLPPVLPDLLAPEPGEEDEAHPEIIEDDTELANGAREKDKLVKAEDNTNQPAIRNKEPRFTSGLVGKLRIRQSGRAELVWGGTNMEVNLGTNPSFLQTAVMTRFNNSGGRNMKGAANETEYHGDAISLGQVRGKLVVTPDWETILR